MRLALSCNTCFENLICIISIYFEQTLYYPSLFGTHCVLSVFIWDTLCINRLYLGQTLYYQYLFITNFVLSVFIWDTLCFIRLYLGQTLYCPVVKHALHVF